MRKWIAPLLVAMLVLSVATPAIAKPARKHVSVSHRHAAKHVSAAKHDYLSHRYTAKRVFISHPYVSKHKVKAGADFKAWGYVKQRVAKSTESTVTIVVAKWEGKRSWVASSGLETIGTLKARNNKFKNKMKYKATMNVPATGRYRMRATIEWVDAKGATHEKRSSWKYIRVVR